MPEAAIAIPAPQIQSGTAQRILIIDDEAAIRESLEALLALAGYTVETAVNGEAGLGRIEENSYDLVLLAYVHLPPDEFAALLQRAASALAPDGTLLVVGHDVDNIAHGHGGPQDPRILHRVQDVVAALPGLAIQRAEQARRPVLTGDGERAAIDSVVRAQRR